MTIDPAVIITIGAAVGGLLLLIYRALVTGALHPRSLVPREDYEAQRDIAAELASAIPSMAESMKKLSAATDADRVRRNGAP